MITYLKFGIAILLPAVAAVLLFCLERNGKFRRIPPKLRSVLYGVIFGGFAVLGTEFGIPMNGAQVNCRDAAVLIAGLMFDAPAGLIAGFIGGTERWFAVYWGIGTYTRVACTLSTYCAGIFSAVVHRFMLEKKKPECGTALFIGIAMEVFHMCMVFFTNTNDASNAINVVRNCTFPMLTANGLSVFAAAVLISFAAQGKEFLKFKNKSETPVFDTIQRGLLAVIAVCLIATCLFVYRLENNQSLNDTAELLQNAIDDTTDELEEQLQNDTLSSCRRLAVNRHVGQRGSIIITDEADVILSSSAGFSSTDFSHWLRSDQADTTDSMQKTSIGENTYYYCTETCEGYTIWAIYPTAEANIQRDIMVYLTLFLVTLIFMAVYGLLYMIIKNIILDQLVKITDSLSRISAGKLDEVVDVRSNQEFASLSDDINQTVDTLKHYIAEAAARIDAELQTAEEIQLSALPNAEIVFPNRNDFEICAKMDPAKQVGGDFYDFYLTDRNKLNIMIADVSGKGIPGAMFMMRAKSTLKDLTDGGATVDRVFTEGNHRLCSGNDADMFVTAWQGRIHLDTGLVEYANAGHNAPLVKHGDQPFEYLKQKPNLVLAAMDGIPYKKHEFQIAPGDIILLYTDGLVEANDADRNLYGDDRLLKIVNSRPFSSMQEMLAVIREDVDRFVGDAPQFDDLTMLALKYNGSLQELQQETN